MYIFRLLLRKDDTFHHVGEGFILGLGFILGGINNVKNVF